MNVCGRIFIFISSFNLFYGISWNYPIFDIPTLLTKIETSMPFRFLIIDAKNPYLSESEKSATIHFVSISRSSFDYLIFLRAFSILSLFLATMQMLKPRDANYSQKPSPIPSLPPVTKAHDL
jgi:hypothetical protein